MDRGTRELDVGSGRRRSRPGKAAAALILVAVALLVAAPGAGALRSWCRSDPVIRIDGDLADIFVAAPFRAPLRVTGPTEVVVTVPKGVDTRLVLRDPGFGRGVNVAFEHSRRLEVSDRGIEVQVRVLVPADDDTMPVRVEFAPRVVGVLRPASAEGTANHWITLRTRF